jgi:3-oxoacyl-[acyl-carrier protein] reductase
LAIEQRVAIVTGVGRDIGQAVAERLATDGRLVVAVSRAAEALEDVRQRIEAAGGAVEVRPCNIDDGEALSALIEETASTHGRLDILVNSAGITRDGLLPRMSDADFDDVINANLRSAFVACRAAARPMMRNRFGRIVNIGSVIGLVGDAGQANYAAAKGGLVGLTKTLARELGAKGITANLVAPGFVETSTLDQLPQERKDDAIKAVPLRRFGRPEEIAHAVSFVTSDLAGYMTGRVLVIDGGLAA